MRFIIAALAWACLLTANAEQMVVSVQRVLSGDTIAVRTSQGMVHVRISGIVAPDAANASGQKSKANLARLTNGRDVRLDCFAVEEFRRKVCRAYVGEIDLGFAQIQSGMARLYLGPAGEQEASDRRAYENTEKQAESRGIGLWGNQKPGSQR